MGHHKTHSPIKQDRPAWRWQGRGRYEYTTSPAAAAYVAAFAARKQAAELARIARFTYVPPMPVTDSARLIEARSRVPSRRVA
jgi:hypothetical protein